MKNKRDISIQEEANKLSFGERGLRILDSSSIPNTNENFGVINILEECTFVADCNSISGDQTIALTLSPGNTLYGNFNNIDITTGRLIGYIK